MSKPITTERLLEMAGRFGSEFEVSAVQHFAEVVRELVERRDVVPVSWQEVCADGILRWHAYQDWGHHYASSHEDAETRCKESDEEHECGPHRVEALGVIQ